MTILIQISFSSSSSSSSSLLQAQADTLDPEAVLVMEEVSLEEVLLEVSWANQPVRFFRYVPLTISSCQDYHENDRLHVEELIRWWWCNMLSIAKPFLLQHISSNSFLHIYVSTNTWPPQCCWSDLVQVERRNRLLDEQEADGSKLRWVLDHLLRVLWRNLTLP